MAEKKVPQSGEEPEPVLYLSEDEANIITDAASALDSLLVVLGDEGSQQSEELRAVGVLLRSSCGPFIELALLSLRPRKFHTLPEKKGGGND